VAWALAARQWQIAPQAALQAYLWSWCENQIMVLMKALPMGQQAGQILQGELLPQIAMRDTAGHDDCAGRWQRFCAGAGFLLGAA